MPPHRYRTELLRFMSKQLIKYPPQILTIITPLSMAVTLTRNESRYQFKLPFTKSRVMVWAYTFPYTLDVAE